MFIYLMPRSYLYLQGQVRRVEWNGKLHATAMTMKAG